MNGTALPLGDATMAVVGEETPRVCEEVIWAAEVLAVVLWKDGTMLAVELEIATLVGRALKKIRY